jgi:hypothetical protein
VKREERCPRRSAEPTCGGEDEGSGGGGAEDLLDVVDDGFRELGEGGGAVILVAAVHSPEDGLRDVGRTGDKQVVAPGRRVVLHRCKQSWSATTTTSRQRIASGCAGLGASCRWSGRRGRGCNDAGVEVGIVGWRGVQDCGSPLTLLLRRLTVQDKGPASSQ